VNETTTFDMIVEFNQLSGQEVNWPATWPSKDTLQLKLSLIKEELKELEEELDKCDNLYNTGKELADVLFTVHGLATSLGINSQACLLEVSESNLSKYTLDKDLATQSVKLLNQENEKGYCSLGQTGHYYFVRRNSDGKVLKPISYFSPDMTNCVYTKKDLKQLNRDEAIARGFLKV